MSRTATRLGLAALFAATALTSQALAADAAGDAKFKALYTREWAWRSAELDGQEGEDSTDRMADHLPRIDAAHQTARLAYWTKVMAELDAIPAASLSPEAKINAQIYRDQIAVLINQQKFRDYEKPLNGDSAFWSDLTGEARKPLRDAAEYERYITQLGDFPRYFGEEIVNMRAGLARGFTPPQVVLKGRDASIASVAEAKGEANPYFGPLKQMPASIPAADQARLKAKALAAIESSVIPAYAELLTFMRTTYLPAARADLAAETLPDGRAYYQSKIKEFTTLDMTADQIHALGLSEVAKIHAQMLDVMKETGFQGDFPAFLTYLRTDPKFYAKTPEELLMRAAWIAKRFDGKADQYFGYLPRKRFAIIPVPDDIAPYYTSGRGGPGVYLVNTYNLPSRPLYNLTALTLHESAPGHAFQMPIAMEHKEQPEFRQKVYISAFGEGWALYCEKLGLEMGMYETPYDRFGMLTYQMWRAARLVVDTGIHSKGWTREQAQRFLHDNTALSDHEIETEVDRYIGWPGQALAYYLGEATILAAREKAEKALGPKFNLRAFHDTVLELGSVPMPVLTARIDRFIAEGGKGPYPDLE
ncbi:DUF885 domain-containing protein [Phenylobacterium aquaticum]|uniref:DUF885 domain-containing protein n=1 Tax=Phenylobacterium aquaticum TaxID=1763816 RepID=UPI001F5C4CAB|nr:DUF885 family protein [Phenylobacterium aquaticum]MCI3134308.1 DUF885 family protein [Phenylobacterium aquaticum]